MCCGETKTSLHPNRSDDRFPDPDRAWAATRRQGGEPPDRFEYTGPTRLTVRGPGSGRTYVFAKPGAVLAVDPRDGASLLGVPGLRPARR